MHEERPPSQITATNTTTDLDIEPRHDHMRFRKLSHPLLRNLLQHHPLTATRTPFRKIGDHLTQLAKGQALWKTGDHLTLVQHHLTHTEKTITDTDTSMRG